MNAIQKIEQLLTGAGKRVYLIRDAVFSAGWLVQNCEFPAVLLFERRPRNYVQKGVGPMRERIGCKMVCVTTTSYEFQTTENDAIQETQRTELLSCLTLLRRSHDFDDLTIGQSAAVYDGAVGVLLTGAAVDVEASLLAGECGVLPDAGMNITENGRHQVVGLSWVDVDVQGGSPAVVEPLEVEPTNEAQTFTPPAGVDGFAPVTVGACPVCPAPDVRPLSVVPSRDSQTFSPMGFDGFAPVEVQGYTPNLQAKTAEPATTAQVVTADQGYDGLSSVTVDAVTAAIDANIVAGNVKKNVTILGVTGTMEPKPDGDWFETFNGQRFYSETEITAATAPADFGCADARVMHYSKLATISSNVMNQTGMTLLCEEMIFPSLTNLSRFSVNGNRKKVICGVLVALGSSWIIGAITKLRHFEVGQGTAINLPMSAWTATDVIAEGQSGIDELNYNIKTYIADKVADRTNDTALTVTFGASLYNVLTADTIAAFTAKNWNVASA